LGARRVSDPINIWIDRPAIQIDIDVNGDWSILRANVGRPEQQDCDKKVSENLFGSRHSVKSFLLVKKISACINLTAVHRDRRKRAGKTRAKPDAIFGASR
jgi:hypothetical protein